MAHLQDADDLLLPAVRASIAALDLTGADTAAATLAERYAAVIDASLGNRKDAFWTVRSIGPLLNAVLNDLGATPLARDRIRDVRPPGGANRLTALREARRA